MQLHGRLLRHKVTGEEVLLEDGAVLGFGGAGGRSFVTVGSKTTWANSLFKWSAWEHIAGKLFVFRRLGDGWEAKWHSDMEKEAVHGSFSLGALGALGAQAQPWPLVQFKVDKPDTGCRLFWCFDTCASLANAPEPGKLAANWMRYPATQRADMLGVTKQHMLLSYRASGTSGAEVQTTSSFFAVSTFSVLILMSWTVPGRARGDMHEHASQLLASWRTAALPLDFVVQLDMGAGAGMDFQVQQGRVEFAQLRKGGGYKKLTASQKRAVRSLPQKSIPIHQALSCLGLKEASSSAWLISQVVRGCAQAAEQKLTHDMALGCSSGLSLASCLPLRELMACRNIYRFGKKVSKKASAAVKKLARDCLTPEEARLQVRYHRAAQQKFSGARRIAVAPDGTRISKRERLCGPIMDLDSGFSAWCAPQATHRNKDWIRPEPEPPY